VTRPLLNSALRKHLAADSDGQVYDQPAAFTAFIRGGGNVGLYDAVSAALAGLYRRYDVSTVVDIGCGDGRAVVPAVAGLDLSVTLVEPSAALLSSVPLDGAVLVNTDAASFVDGLSARFDLAESTFALHTLPHAERSAVLTALRPHAGRLVVAEFDVPGDPLENLGFLADTYERGLAEYDSDRELVAQGFLMPVLVGQLAPGVVRNTFEQPASEWVAQVVACGYRDVVVEPLFDYWSSPAFLLTALGDG
jgi:SAM-dependent methyltransferase